MVILQVRLTEGEVWTHRLVATYKEGRMPRKRTSPWVDTMVPVMLRVQNVMHIAFGAPWEGTGLKTQQVYQITEVIESDVEVLRDAETGQEKKAKRKKATKKKVTKRKTRRKVPRR